MMTGEFNTNGELKLIGYLNTKETRTVEHRDLLFSHDKNMHLSNQFEFLAFFRRCILT
jgi:hypothetical protein